MKKLTKKAAQRLIHQFVPGVKVGCGGSTMDCISTYIARTPGMVITCMYNHVMPWDHICLTIDTGAARAIIMQYNPETLERDYEAEDAMFAQAEIDEIEAYPDERLEEMPPF